MGSKRSKDKLASLESGMGVAMDIWSKLLQKVRQRELPVGAIHQLSTPEGDTILDKFVDILAGGTKSIFIITLNHTLSLTDMIAAGHYDWVNDDITAEHFPVKGKGAAELAVELVHFDRSISSGDAVKEMEKMGLRPATHEELLAFGAKYPDIQREFPIVALGSSAQIHGRRFVLFLFRYGSERFLSLFWWDSFWGADYRFLGVRN
ncbi:MAG: hypothetical protein AAB581_04220 [Patescibacteria group bacterium]